MDAAAAGADGVPSEPDVTGRVVLVPDLVWDGECFREGWAVSCDPGTGRIDGVGRVEEVAEGIARSEGAGSSGPREAPEDEGGVGEPRERGVARKDESRPPRPTVERLPGRALLPGFVNAHSHAFQRLIRGRTQWKPAGEPEADFWSWRETMYAAASSLSPKDVFVASRWCFLEMLRAGWTTVGEFHYLHRDPEGRPYDDPGELALRVVAAARDVGIRIALLNVCYATGGIGKLLASRQRRFATPDLEGYTRDTEALAGALADDPLTTVGAAPHSVRAVPREWMRPLGEWARSRGMPLHMHVSERPREVADCRAAHGLPPVALAAEEGLLDGRFTGIHATHLAPEEVRLLGQAQGTACLCPTTERDLGDGIPPSSELSAAGAGFALGSDSHTVIDPFEEMRLVEYHERLRSLGRVLLTRRGDGPAPDGGGRDRTADVGDRHRSPDGSDRDRLRVAPGLLSCATRGGARSLGLELGALRKGAAADMVAVDLRHRALAGWTPDILDACLAFSATSEVVTDVWVAGTRRVRKRQHPREPEARSAFDLLARKLAERS